MLACKFETDGKIAHVSVGVNPLAVIYNLFAGDIGAFAPVVIYELPAPVFNSPQQSGKRLVVPVGYPSKVSVNSVTSSHLVVNENGPVHELTTEPAQTALT